jgi:hypothetical protein
MTYEHAKAILDRVRDGVAYPTHTIDKALEMMGDIDGHIERVDADHGSAGVGQAVSQESDGGGQTESHWVVADDLIRHSKKTWSRRR